MVKPYKLKKTMESIQKAMEYDGLSVIISEELCPPVCKGHETRSEKANPSGSIMINAKIIRDCLNLLACPAMYLEGDRVEIDKNACIGCAVCAQVCPENAHCTGKRGIRRFYMETKRLVFIGVGVVRETFLPLVFWEKRRLP